MDRKFPLYDKSKSHTIVNPTLLTETGVNFGRIHDLLRITTTKTSGLENIRDNGFRIEVM